LKKTQLLPLARFRAASGTTFAKTQAGIAPGKDGS
jgi:hypothetical protein